MSLRFFSRQVLQKSQILTRGFLSRDVKVKFALKLSDASSPLTRKHRKSVNIVRMWLWVMKYLSKKCDLLFCNFKHV